METLALVLSVYMNYYGPNHQNGGSIYLGARTKKAAELLFWFGVCPSLVTITQVFSTLHIGFEDE